MKLISRPTLNVYGWFDFIKKRNDFVAKSNKAYLCDITKKGFFMELPESPALGDKIAFIVYKTLESSNSFYIKSKKPINGDFVPLNFCKKVDELSFLFIFKYLGGQLGWTLQSSFNVNLSTVYIGNSLLDTFSFFIGLEGLNGSSNFKDISLQAKKIKKEWTDINFSKEQVKYGTSSIYCSVHSSSNRLKIIDSSYNLNELENLTIECFFYPLPVPFGSGVDVLFGNTSALANGFCIARDGDSNKIYYAFNGSTGLAGNFQHNTWNHIALVQNKANNSLSIFLNGIKIFSRAALTTTSTSSFTIFNDSTANRSFYGFINLFAITESIAKYDTEFNYLSNNTLLYQTTQSLDPYNNNVAFFITGDGLQDSTYIHESSGKLVNTVGGVKISNTRSKYGVGSLKFNGNGQYIYLDHPDLIASNNDFCLEAWIFPKLHKDYSCLFNTQSGDSNTNGFYFGINSYGKIIVYTNSFVYTGSISILLNTWTHISITKSGNIISFYINGFRESLTLSTSIISSNSKIRIGGIEWNSTQSFSGLLSNIRYTLYESRYSNNFNPEIETYLNTGQPIQEDPLANNVVFYLKGTGADNSTIFLDSSFYNRAISKYGDVKISTEQSWQSGGSIKFSLNSNDYLQFTNNISLLGSIYTIEAWVFPTEAASMAIISSTPASSGVGRLLLIEQNGKISYVSGGGAGLVTSSRAINLSQWNHVAVMYTGTNTYICINGFSEQVANNSLTSEGTVWLIGRNARTADYLFPFKGFIGPIRITKGADRPYDINFDPVSDTHFYS